MGSKSIAGAVPAFVCAAAAVLLLLLLPAPRARAAGGQDRIERSIVHKLNVIRRAGGLPRLRTSRALARAADVHCRDMLAANFFAHASSNGTPMAQRVESFRRATSVGETLAYVPAEPRNGQAARIVAMWMASPPHRAALLDGRFRRIGVARRHGALGGERAAVFTADLSSKH